MVIKLTPNNMQLFRDLRKSIDVQLAFRNLVWYTAAIVSLAIIFFMTEFLIEKYLYTNDEIVDIATSIMGAFIFLKLKDFFDKITDRVFFAARYDYSDAIKKLNEGINATIDLHELLQFVWDLLRKTIKPERAVFFSYDSWEPVVFGEWSSSREKATCLKGYRAIIRQWQALPEQEMISADSVGADSSNIDVRIASLVVVAQKAGIAAIVPFSSKEGIIMVMLVGRKLSGEPLRPRDYDLISAISHQAGMAIENARLYRALRTHSDALERRVAEKTERIRQMYEAQSKFLTDVAHEFQTPLSILKGNLLILAKPGKSDRANALYVAGTTVDRLSRLVQHLLDIAKLNFSKNKLYRRPIDIRALFEEAQDDCAVLVEDRGVNLSISSEHLFVSGDKDKLKEVLLNLISNALKHTPAGGSVSLSAVRDGEDVKISVADTGNGIAPENLSKIFDRFYKIDRHGDGDGSGIGLHLCRQIIEAHGGTIIAESNVGKETRFIVHLPSAKPNSGVEIFKEADTTKVALV